MANEMQRAQYALMAALHPEQFIELAVSQGFKPEQMIKAIPNFKAKTGPVEQATVTAPPTGPSPALKTLMGLQGQAPGATAGPPPIPMPASPPQVPQMPTSMAPNPAAFPQPNLGMGAAPPPTIMPPPQPQYEAPTPIPDPSQARAAAITVPPMPGAPPTGQLPPQQTMGAIPTRPPTATPPLSQVATPPTSVLDLLGLGGLTATMPGPQEGIIPSTPPAPATPTGPAGPTMGRFGMVPQLAPPPPAAPSPPVDWNSLDWSSPNALGLSMRGALSNPAAAATAAAPQNVGLGGVPPMPNIAVTPPPPPTPPSGPSLRPVSSAGVQTAETTKTPPPAGAPTPEQKKAAIDALSQVGASGLGGKGGGRGREMVGSAGTHMGAIQQGELLDLILKSMAPANYTPGYIPYGKLF